MRVIVQGGGVVGSATGRILSRAGHVVEYHDPALELFAGDSADVCVICTSCLDGMLPPLDIAGRAETVVVRSTVLPSAFAVLEPGKRHHWPEFLTERTAQYDAQHPDKLVWGSDLSASEAEPFVRGLLGAHYDAAPVLHTSLRASAMIKLGINTYYTAKVLMANALYDAVDGDPDDYAQVCAGLGLDKRINLTHHNVWQDGFRGAVVSACPRTRGSWPATSRARLRGR